MIWFLCEEKNPDLYSGGLMLLPLFDFASRGWDVRTNTERRVGVREHRSVRVCSLLAAICRIDLFSPQPIREELIISPPRKSAGFLNRFYSKLCLLSFVYLWKFDCEHTLVFSCLCMVNINLLGKEYGSCK